MIRLERNPAFNNGYQQLIKRTEKVALFSINGGMRYMVTRIYVSPKYYDPYWLHHFPAQEFISNGRQFYSDGSKDIEDKDAALRYFDKLNKELEENMRK